MRQLGAIAVLLALAAPTLAPGGAAGAPGGSATGGLRPAVFEVGAAAADIDPSYPVYMGGYGGGPAGGTIARHIDPLTGRPEHFTVRAIAIAAGGHVDELATVDTQGYFAGYQEGPYGLWNVRQSVAAWLRSHGVSSATSADVIISSEHEHAAPTLLGIWGPPQHQLAYLARVAAALTAVLERAYARARPATITWGDGDAPWVSDRVIAEGNAFEGWPRDGSIGVLWARDARSGRTIAIYASEPGYPNIVYGPGDLLGPGGRAGAVLSSDFPNYADAFLEQRLGGIAIVTDGTLGNQTSALQTDDAPSPDLPAEGGMRQTRAFDDIIHFGQLFANLIVEALAHGHPITTPIVAAADRYISSPVYNPILIADDRIAPIGGGDFFDALTGGRLYPTDRSFAPPYGNGATSLSTWVTAFRIGDLLFTSMPGEFFPSTHAAWLKAISGPQGNFVIGAAQDFLGYLYPVYAYPFTYEGSDEGIFNPSLTLGDQVVDAGELDARALGFRAELTAGAEYTALQNRYLAATRPGVQFLPFPQSGDLASRGQGFTPVLEGISQPPRVGPLGACLADTLTSCPVPPPAMGAFDWSFGDGAGALTPAQSYARAYYSPFVRHRYCRAGSYVVSVSAVDSSGDRNGMSLPIRVYPPLHVRIRERGRRLVAQVSGGSGQVLYVVWRIGRRLEFGSSVAPPAGVARLSVLVTDGTGTMAGARARYRSGRLGRSRAFSPPGATLADPAAVGRCPG